MKEEYVFPQTLAQALAARKAGFLPYGGGTDLMVRHKNDLQEGWQPSFSFLAHVPELSGIQVDADGLTVGALATMAEVAADERVPPLLRKACLGVGSPGLRNVATLGGNICSASPAGDSLPPLYLYQAQLNLCSTGGERHLALADFIRGVGQTALTDDELLVSIRIPASAWTRTMYRKVSSRTTNAISKVSLAGAMLLDGKRIVACRLAFGAVGATVIRCYRTEQALVGQRITEACHNREQWLNLLRNEVLPIDDLRSTALYRREVAVNLARQFVCGENDGL